ncbi:MAG: hypothetical protein MUF51_07690 [Vicinamibacteria bacterium]|jgi:hypothetical protein|nr:hypothetical protein [Vicinamibacteria bacterium]
MRLNRVFSLRCSSRFVLDRCFACLLLIKLLIVSSLPANLQAATVLFPVSMLCRSAA